MNNPRKVGKTRRYLAVLAGCLVVAALTVRVLIPHDHQLQPVQSCSVCNTSNLPAIEPSPLPNLSCPEVAFEFVAADCTLEFHQALFNVSCPRAPPA